MSTGEVYITKHARDRAQLRLQDQVDRAGIRRKALTDQQTETKKTTQNGQEIARSVSNALLSAVSRLRSGNYIVGANVEPGDSPERVRNEDYRTLALAYLAEHTIEGTEGWAPVEQIARECIEMLTTAGYGQPGSANTLWAMVRDACRDRARLEKTESAVADLVDECDRLHVNGRSEVADRIRRRLSR